MYVRSVIILIAAAFGAVCLVDWLGAEGAVRQGHPPAGWAQVHPGMTKAEVRQVIADEPWVNPLYSRVQTWEYMDIYDTTKVLMACDIHLVDGIVKSKTCYR